MNETNLISIITPVLNAGDLLIEAGDSVIHQSYSNWEWIVIDNGSEDGCVENLKARLSDSRIRYLKEPTKGVSWARNKGFSEMRGSFVCFLDADDILPEKSLQSRLDILLKDDSYGFADGVVDIFDHLSGKTLFTYNPQFAGEPTQELLSLSGRCFFGNTWMIRVEEGRDYSFPCHMTHSEDLAFYLSICRGRKYAYTYDKVLRCRRNHTSAVTNLDGVEKGYRDLVSYLKDLGYSDAEILKYSQKAKDITKRTWLKNGKILKYIKTLTSQW